MKICYLADAANAHTQKWARFFTNRGNDVHVISFQAATIPRVKVYYVRAPLGKVGYLLISRRISRLIQTISPDLLHAHHATSYGFVGALSGYRPYIISSWGSDVIWSPKQSFLFDRILRYNFKRTDQVTATSQMLAQATSVFCPPETRVHIIPFGVDTSTFFPYADSEIERKVQGLTVGIVKTMRPRYGIKELILAFRQISNKFPNVRLVIVGGGEQLAHLRAMVADLNLETRINLTGPVNHNDIPKYLNSFDIFVVPSLTDRESFGVAAVEASACGLPVIASHVGGLPEVVLDGKTGILVPPGNVDALTEAMSGLLSNPALRSEMGQAGRQFVLEHYRWEDNAKLMENLYHKTLERLNNEQN